MSETDKGERGQKPSKTILLVHQDLGFVVWLGQLLTQRGHVVVPATTAKVALRLIEELEISRIDLLIARLASVETPSLIATLQSRRETLKVVGIEDADLGRGHLEFPSGRLATIMQALENNKAGGAG